MCMWFKSWENMRSSGKSTVTVIGQEAKTDHMGMRGGGLNLQDPLF